MNQVVSMAAKRLPDICYGIEPKTGDPIIVRRGAPGYWRAKIEASAIDMMNDRLGVSKAQAAAMVHGALFGWGLSIADPTTYDERGRIKPNDGRVMTPDELRRAVEASGMTQSTFAALIGVAPRTLREWLGGATAVPMVAAILIRVIQIRGFSILGHGVG